jgi:hypothetical protein
MSVSLCVPYTCIDCAAHTALRTVGTRPSGSATLKAKNFSSDELQELMHHFIAVKVYRGDVFYKLGDSPDCFYVVHDGKPDLNRLLTTG